MIFIIRVVNNLRRNCDAPIADVNTRASDQLPNLGFLLPAERATDLFNLDHTSNHKTSGELLQPYPA